MVFAVATGITGCVWSSAGQPVPYVICGTTLNAVGNGASISSRMGSSPSRPATKAGSYSL